MAFENKVIVITGASDGIGAELARQLARERPRLVLAARGAEGLERGPPRMPAAVPMRSTSSTDVGVEEDCRRLMERAVASASATSTSSSPTPACRCTPASTRSRTSPTFERLFRINAMGTIWCVRHAYPSLKRTRGLVVGVSSLAGRTGVPGRTTYCTSKFAQSGFLEAFRIEAADHGVDVMAVFPGVVKTEIRRHGWNGRGEPAGVSGLAEDDAMPVEECARQIVDGMRATPARGRDDRKARVGLWLKLLAPAKVDAMARAALARNQQQPH